MHKVNDIILKLQDKIKKMGFDGQSVINSETIPFDITLIKLCEMNACGNYAKNYTCPPYVGEPAGLIKKAKTYERLLAFNKIYAIADSFDIEGMDKGNMHFNALVKNLALFLKSFNIDFLLLTAGGCRICKICAAVENLPCRHPEHAFASLEAYCINVSSLAETCKLNYINGPNTVTYFGGILFNANQCQHTTVRLSTASPSNELK